MNMRRFYMTLIFLVCKMESISVLPNTHAGKRGKASDICKHGILPYPKVLKIGKPFVLL